MKNRTIIMLSLSIASLIMLMIVVTGNPYQEKELYAGFFAFIAFILQKEYHHLNHK